MINCPNCKFDNEFPDENYKSSCRNCQMELRIDLKEIFIIPEYIEECSCSKKNCPRHNKCRECHDHHHFKNGKLPRCIRKRTGELKK